MSYDWLQFPNENTSRFSPLGILLLADHFSAATNTLVYDCAYKANYSVSLVLSTCDWIIKDV